LWLRDDRSFFRRRSGDIRTSDGANAGQQGVMTSVRTPIGSELGEIAAATSLLADELRPLLDSSAAAALEDLVHAGKSDACRIAVIGQVKAGKSTLINALTRRPGFLPTDVNPWTAVVTNLHFGRPSAAGAIFQFFEETDWRHLAAGGRLFELSQRLGIELDAYILASQVRSMRERAEQRLGEQFQLLLGRQHRFAHPSADVLERYVCVGDFDLETRDGDSTPETGRFADITRSADLYFDLPPFGHPATIVDTPGINDPFLVRDEISREALKSADAYVVVLNAQQALTTSDLDLLRLLHGLQKSRLVVFVNRVDQLATPAKDGAAVASHVGSKLALEFPGVAIPIVVGSALWAVNAIARQTDVPPSSGLDGLAEVLSRLIARGPTMLRLQRRQIAMCDIISKIDVAARGELSSLEMRMSAADGVEPATNHLRARTAERLRRIDAVTTNVVKLVENANANLTRVQTSAARRLKDALQDVIRRHAAAASETLLAQPGFARRDRVWRFPTLPLRRDLEQKFQSIYWEAAGRLRGIARTTNAELLNKVADLMPAQLAAEDAPIYSIDPEPSISALGQTVAVELDGPWRAWWRIWQSQKRRAEELERILLADFTPVVDALVTAAESELAAHIVVSAERFSRLGRDLVAMLNRHKLDVEADRLRQTQPQTEVSGPGHELEARRIYLEARIENCVRIADALKLLIGRFPLPSHG
jgi:tRNA U34 5-carboxymethylaminomethyl modifying GTPase MnmE/TrmE